MESSHNQSRRDDGISIRPILIVARRAARALILTPLIAAIAAFVTATVWPPTYVATTTLIPPQQKQTATATMLQSIGALSGLAGAATGIRNPSDQYVAFLKSRSVAEKLADQFKLHERYETGYREELFEEIADRTTVTASKDGLIRIDYSDRDPDLAASIANGYVLQLKSMLDNMAITEAQQRSRFYEDQIARARGKLRDTQVAMYQSGFTEADIKAEPRVVAERFALLSAELTAARVKLQSIRRFSTERSQEYLVANSEVSALENELARIKSSNPSEKDGQYIVRYRDYKYQEALLEMFIKQYELAKIDEAMEGPLVQVVDAAVAPQRPAHPKRTLWVVGAALASLFFAFIWVALRARLEVFEA